MRNINRVIIAGNLTREPELRQTPGGTPVLQFGMAVNDSRKNQQTGEWEDRANFIDCVVFGERANALSQYLHKGMKVTVEGKLRWTSWQDKETGKNRSKVEVVVDEVELPPRQQQPAQQPPAPQYQQQAPQYQQPTQQPPQYQAQQPPQQAYQQPAQQPPAPQQAYQPPQQQYAQQAPYQQPTAAPPAQQPPQQADVYDEDIPF